MNNVCKRIIKKFENYSDDYIKISDAIDIVKSAFSVGECLKTYSTYHDVVAKMDSENLIDGKTNNEVYQKFLSLYQENDAPNIISLSLYITRYFNYIIINKKAHGKKYRIFVKS